MTTIREKSTAALAEALFAADHDFTEFGVAGTEQAASMMLAVSPTLARRLDLGTALDEAVAALPEGYSLSVRYGLRAGVLVAIINAWHHDGRRRSWQVERPTPTDALIALAEALTLRSAGAQRTEGRERAR